MKIFLLLAGESVRYKVAITMGFRYVVVDNQYGTRRQPYGYSCAKLHIFWRDWFSSIIFCPLDYAGHKLFIDVSDPQGSCKPTWQNGKWFRRLNLLMNYLASIYEGFISI